ncbi:hypothetical protein [Thalassotalea mangrovi]|uniref:Uncharacterized protein n=1 Tax=Thalassotalea mangrovi TaxID=2572245 RepID=A0A4U1B250_9GAMM|nr:hypothetical protein [Thalassotalea mangrovi]TKB43664.1 hypothetical protein E8M12_14430 [Thalassotalea mangrovi]
MKRHFCISDNLSNLHLFSLELEQKGFLPPQFRILSDQPGINQLNQYFPKGIYWFINLYRSEIHTIFWYSIAGLLLYFGYVLGLTQTDAGWIPLIAIIIVFVALTTVLSVPDSKDSMLLDRKRLMHELESGKHVLVLDVEDEQEVTLFQTIMLHPELEFGEFKQ